MRIQRTQLMIRLEPKLKAKIKKIAKVKRRDMNSLVLIWIEEKITEVENA